MTQGNQNGDAGPRQNIQIEDGFRTRYSLQNPPEKLKQMLYELAKATKSPGYRKHGGFPDSNAIRSLIFSVIDATRGDADDIVRFLKKFGFLVPKEDPDNPGKIWAFDAEGADAQILMISGFNPDIKPPHFSYAVMVVERSSDPGPPPTPAQGEQESGEEPSFAHLHELDDELLDLHEKEVRTQRSEAERKLGESRRELDAIRTEKARRIAARQQELEAEERRIKEQKDELAKQLADLMAR